MLYSYNIHYFLYLNAMKNKTLKIAGIAILLGASAVPASAQYYEIANQLPSLISPALSGSGAYKGSIEAGYSRTLGKYDADFLEFSTSQGYQYNSWFYMGVGLGVDVLFAHQNDGWGNNWAPGTDFDYNHASTKTAAMIPVFTDFRVNLGSPKSASFFIDLKIGCSFLAGKDYIEIGDGYLTNQEYFYLRPSLGVRIPTNSQNPKQAFNIGVSYKLLTSNYWNSWSRSVTLNGLGVNIGYEW